MNDAQVKYEASASSPDQKARVQVAETSAAASQRADHAAHAAMARATLAADDAQIMLAQNATLLEMGRKVDGELAKARQSLDAARVAERVASACLMVAGTAVMALREERAAADKSLAGAIEAADAALDEAKKLAADFRSAKKLADVALAGIPN